MKLTELLKGPHFIYLQLPVVVKPSIIEKAVDCFHACRGHPQLWVKHIRVSTKSKRTGISGAGVNFSEDDDGCKHAGVITYVNSMHLIQRRTADVLGSWGCYKMNYWNFWRNFLFKLIRWFCEFLSLGGCEKIMMKPHCPRFFHTECPRTKLNWIHTSSIWMLWITCSVNQE